MRKQRGFTLIELMIVVGIIAILAAIALPSYFNQIRKSRRNDMEQALLQIAMSQERFRADCPEYANAFAYACSSVTTLKFPANPYTASYYGAPVFSSASTYKTSYKITVTATGGQAKDNAYGTPCSSLTYDYGETTAGQVTKAPADCWAK